MKRIPRSFSSGVRNFRIEFSLTIKLPPSLSLRDILLPVGAGKTYNATPSLAPCYDESIIRCVCGECSERRDCGGMQDGDDAVGRTHPP